MKKLPFIFEARCESGSDAADISIRGVIGTRLDEETWSVTDTETEVLNELSKIPTDRQIKVRINSPGGDHRMSLGVHNALRRRGNVETFNEGYACSGAILVLLAGDKIHCPPGSLAMFHMASAADYGNRKDKQATIEYLTTCDETQAAILAPRMKKTKEEVMALLEKGETWLSGDKMKEMGLSDDDDGDAKPDAETNAFVLKRYKQVPQDLRARLIAQVTAAAPPPTKQKPTKANRMKNITAALVAAGFTVATDAEEDAVLPHITALITERANLKAENERHVTALKNRVTAKVEKAITDKLIKAERKDALIKAGIADESTLEFIDDLRAENATRQPRGVKPAARSGENAEENSEANIIELQEQMAGETTTAEERGALASKSIKLRGLDGLFKKQTAVRQN